MKNKKIDWFKEIKKSWHLLFAGFLKFMQIFANILITIILIGVLTGVIVVSAFSIYIGNYIDTEADMSLFRLNISSPTTRIYYYDFETNTMQSKDDAIILELDKIVGLKN